MKYKKYFILTLQLATIFFLYCAMMLTMCSHNLNMANISLSTSSMYYRIGAKEDARKERALADEYVAKSNNLKKWIPSFMIRKQP